MGNNNYVGNIFVPRGFFKMRGTVNMTHPGAELTSMSVTITLFRRKWSDTQDGSEWKLPPVDATFELLPEAEAAKLVEK